MICSVESRHTPGVRVQSCFARLPPVIQSYRKTTANTILPMYPVSTHPGITVSKENGCLFAMFQIVQG